MSSATAEMATQYCTNQIFTVECAHLCLSSLWEYCHKTYTAKM